MSNLIGTILAIMQSLDVIVSTSTAVVPIAGALGRPTIYLGHASWVMLGQEKNYPWFKSVTPILVPSGDEVSSGIHKVVQLLLNLD